MSRRELKALNAGRESQLTDNRLRSGRMSGSEEQEESPEQLLRAENEQLRQQLRELETVLEETARLEKLLKETKAEAELERLRAVEEVRAGHQRALQREQDLADRERGRANTLAGEKATLEREVEDLRHELQVCREAASRATAGGVETTTETTGREGGAEVATTPSTETTAIEDTREAPATTGRTSTGGEIAGTESGSGDRPGEMSGMITTMTRLLQAQTEALEAQARAATTQHLPPLKPFSGEGKIMEEDSFERWVEQFEERANLIGWNEAQQLHQLKLLLEKTASKVFQMFSVEDKATYARAKAALQARFRSVDIEELRGMEFHRLVQGS